MYVLGDGVMRLRKIYAVIPEDLYLKKKKIKLGYEMDSETGEFWKVEVEGQRVERCSQAEAVEEVEGVSEVSLNEEKEFINLVGARKR